MNAVIRTVANFHAAARHTFHVNAVLKSVYLWIVIATALSVVSDNPGLGLCVGALISLSLGNPAKPQTSSLSKKMLQLAIVLLGFGLQFSVILKVGFASVWITMISISCTMLVGFILSKIFSIDNDLGLLVTTGTAICGGSAIAAMAPSIGASEMHTAIAMAVVFLLNGVALLVFPHVGHIVGLSQTNFGLWSALAIHDTSSVVGAASIYGMQALAVGTTVKLTRALWILPVAFAGSKLRKSENKAKFPWFLLFFLLAALLRSYLPSMEHYFNDAAVVGKRLMVFTLFLIGGGLTWHELKKIGAKPLVMAVILWVIVSTTSLFIISHGWIHLNIPNLVG